MSAPDDARPVLEGTSPSDAPRLAPWLIVAVLLAAVLGTRLWIEMLPVDNRLTSIDLSQFFYPSSRFVGEEYAAGRLPLWNPYLGLGTNQLADVQIELFYPLTLLYVLLPAHWAIDVVMLLHLALATTGVLLLCRASGLSPAAALVGAVALATGETVHLLAGWPSMLATFAWCPVALFAARRVGDDPGPRTALVLASVLALQILAGYVQLHLYTVVLLPLFAVPRAGLLSRATVRVLAWLALAELGAAALGAIALAPAMAAVADSLRSRDVMQPWFYEAIPVRLTDYFQGLAAHRPQGSAPLFFGAVVPVLALAGLLARGLVPRLRWPAMLLGGIAVVLSLGRASPVFELLWKLPISNWLTGPYKWTYLAGLALVLLAAVGAEGLLAWRTMTPARRVSWVLAAAGLLLVFPFSLAQRVLGGVVIVAALVLGMEPGEQRRRALAALLLAGVAAGSVCGIVGRGSRPRDQLGFFAGMTPAFRHARVLQATAGAGRLFVLAPPLSVSLRHAELERVAQINTMETLQPVRTYDVVRAIERDAAGDPAARARAVALLRAIGAELVLTPHDQAAWLAELGLERAFASRTVDVWRDPGALPRAYLATTIEQLPRERVLERLGRARPGERLAVLETGAAGGTSPIAASPGDVEVVQSRANEVRLAVSAPGPALLVLLDSWNAGWRALVDGKPVPIRHANLVGRAVELPAGAREVVFQFRPRPFYFGAAVSALATTGWLAAALVLWSRRTRASR